MDQLALSTTTTTINKVSIVAANKIKIMGMTMPVCDQVTLHNKNGILGLATMAGEDSNGISTAVAVVPTAAVVTEEDAVAAEDFSVHEVVLLLDAGDVEVVSVTIAIKGEGQLGSKMEVVEEETTIGSDHEMTMVTTVVVEVVVAGEGSMPVWHY